MPDGGCRAVGSHRKLYSNRGTECEGYRGPRPGLRTDRRQVSKVGAASGSRWGSLEGGRSPGLGLTGVRARAAPGSLGFHPLAHRAASALASSVTHTAQGGAR